MKRNCRDCRKEIEVPKEYANPLCHDCTVKKYSKKYEHRWGKILPESEIVSCSKCSRLRVIHFEKQPLECPCSKKRNNKPKIFDATCKKCGREVKARRTGTVICDECQFKENDDWKKEKNCPYCGKEFNDPYALHKHKGSCKKFQEAGGLFLITCIQCGEKFRDKKTREEIVTKLCHKCKSDSRQAKYECICGRKFDDGKSYRGHTARCKLHRTKIAKNPIEIQCQFCSFSSSKRSILKHYELEHSKKFERLKKEMNDLREQGVDEQTITLAYGLPLDLKPLKLLNYNVYANNKKIFNYCEKIVSQIEQKIIDSIIEDYKNIEFSINKISKKYKLSERIVIYVLLIKLGTKKFEQLRHSGSSWGHHSITEDGVFCSSDIERAYYEYLKRLQTKFDFEITKEDFLLNCSKRTDFTLHFSSYKPIMIELDGSERSEEEWKIKKDIYKQMKNQNLISEFKILKIDRHLGWRDYENPKIVELIEQSLDFLKPFLRKEYEKN